MREKYRQGANRREHKGRIILRLQKLPSQICGRYHLSWYGYSIMCLKR